jgi:2-amino-4-hydroxy-6-hydroxymethyldihydropteridine diphosphokinase
MLVSDAQEPRVYLSLGSNLGDRENHLVEALSELADRGVQIVSCSSAYETEPLEIPDQPDFLNIVVEVRTCRSPQDLLLTCLEAERALGRRRVIKSGPRTIDIDLLFYGGAVIAEAELTVPHPRLYRRNFVLAPLAEIAPDFRDPVTGRTAKQLLDQSPDRSRVKRIGPFERGNRAQRSSKKRPRTA